MHLYHFTASQFLEPILKSGHLLRTESNLSRRRRHAGPRVVWLTANPDPWAFGHSGHGLGTSILDKRQVRFTLDLDKRSVRRWREWAPAHGIDRDWMTDLAASGGSSTWWVSERDLPVDTWVDITYTESGDLIWRSPRLESMTPQ